MSEEIVTIKIFSDELEATMAHEALQEAGLRSFVSKDDAGGMEPHLQRSSGVRLVVNRADAERAQEILQSMES